MLDRLELLIGKDSLSKLINSCVLVLGLGGVGGYVVEALIRSGISRVIIVDFDRIDITNLNRQIIANTNNIGEFKTEEFKKRILSINPSVEITCINSFIDGNNIDTLFNYKIDYFIDCCDSINTKKLVISKCLENKIKLITSMGTGNRMDPSKLVICDIRDTNYDPVAKIIRKYVKDIDIKDKIVCLSSLEKPIRKGIVVGSNSFVPSSAGFMIAGYVVNDIIKKEN